MAKTETIAGVVPVPRGPYDSGNTYYKYNLTQLYGSTYMSKIDDNTTAPATMDAEGNITVNENWEVWADASGVPALQKEIEKRYKTIGFAGIVDDAISPATSEEDGSPSNVYYSSLLKAFVLKSGEVYYTTWNNAVLWNDVSDEGSSVASSICYYINSGKQYVFDGSNFFILNSWADFYRIAYSNGYIDIDTSVEGKLRINLTDRVRFKTNESPFYIDVPKGISEIDKIEASFFSVCYSLEINKLVCVDARYIDMTIHLPLVAMYISGTDVKITHSVIPATLNGVTQEDTIKKYVNGFYAAVVSRGYVNIDVIKSRIVVTDNIYYTIDGKDGYIAKGATDYDLSSVERNFILLVYDVKNSSLKFINNNAATYNEIVLAAISRDTNGNIVSVTDSVIECRINGISETTSLDYLHSISYKSIYTRGYIDIVIKSDDEIDLVLTDALRWKKEEEEIQYNSIAANTFTVESPKSGSYFALVADENSLDLQIVDFRLVKPCHVVLAALNRAATTINSVVSSNLDVRLNGVSAKTRIEALENKIKNELTPEIQQKAAVWEAKNKGREQYLRDKFNESAEPAKWYGVEWREEDNADNVKAINSEGDDELHTTLPIQSKMRRCVVKDEVVQYYLDADNSELKEDGSEAKLDGTDGNVMVEIPEFFYRVESEMQDGTRVIRIKISEQGLTGYQFSPKRYTSAYEATVDRDTNLLASVCTTTFTRATKEVQIEAEDKYIEGTGFSLGEKATAERSGFASNAAKYRGGTNDSSLDTETDISSQDYSRNQLGIPVSYITREHARKLVDVNKGYTLYHYDTQKILYILCQVEYKNRNIQKTALGKGATVYPSYVAYEYYFNKGIVDTGQNGISCLPCGITNALGNKSGEVYYKMINVPVEATGEKVTTEITRWANVWMPVMSYRGVEHFYGHIYKIADGLNIYMGSATGYVEGHDGDSQYAISPVTYYYEPNPYLCNNKADESKNLGTYSMAANICSIKSILMDYKGHTLPIGADNKDYDINYCDCVEITAPKTLMYASYNGRLVSNKLVGLNFVFAQKSVDATGTDARPSDGVRFDFN